MHSSLLTCCQLARTVCDCVARHRSSRCILVDPLDQTLEGGFILLEDELSPD